VRFKLFFLLGLLPLFAGCIFNLYPHTPPSESITGLSWSSDDSSIYAVREKPLDSSDTTSWNYFLEHYNLQGTELSSAQIKKPNDPNWTVFDVVSDGQFLIVGDKTGIAIEKVDLSTQTLIQSNADFESESPSGNIIATDSNLSATGGAPGIDGWYQLTWILNGNSRIIQHWKTHVQMFPSLNILSDKIFSFEEYLTGGNQFSVYDSNLNLLYRMPDPAGDIHAVSYVPSTNAVLAVLHSSGPDRSVVFIDLKTGTISRNAFNQDIIGAAPDGFHIAYLRDHLTLTIRNLFTNAEKDIDGGWPSGALFSPDSSHLCYVVGIPPQIRVVALNGLP